MNYVSTRNKTVSLTASQAIAQGLARDGGLLTPEVFPKITPEMLEDWRGKTYGQRAVALMKLFLEDFSEEELTAFTQAGYSAQKFDDSRVAPLHQLDDNTHCLELWHGPTSAFKDMALQILPHLLSASLVKTNEDKTVCILVATSGDTGKAALEGFKDVDRTKILVFYPTGGVSQVQELQMKTQEGNNVGVCSVYGNFDDAQTGVKILFSDEKLRVDLAQRGYFLSSANSINWGRILPQLVYYISAYCDLLNEGKIQMGDKVNYCVPTGNFGNILACWYAGQMGLPVGKLICASNSNNVLTEFLETGVYNKNRTFYTTMSPSMDILVSSNLERLLFALTGQDDQAVAGYMKQLNETGRYEVSEDLKAKLKDHFYGGFCDETKTGQIIEKVWKEHNYLIDPHTAVAYQVMEDYRKASGDETTTVFVSTASPFKFCDNVLKSLGVAEVKEGLDALDQLNEVSGRPAPVPLASLRNKPVRFEGSVEKEKMMDVVLDFLK
ncbi:MAG: threonine synthase [Ruminiclostridium sp.]|nr:threonine synthase [Ruminiclostridium sp.]